MIPSRSTRVAFDLVEHLVVIYYSLNAKIYLVQHRILYFSEKGELIMKHAIEIKLHKLLMDNKMTYQELSNKTGISLRTISMLVNNKMERIPRGVLCKIADVFELEDIREIIDFKNESK